MPNLVAGAEAFRLHRRAVGAWAVQKGLVAQLPDGAGLAVIYAPFYQTTVDRVPGHPVEYFADSDLSSWFPSAEAAVREEKRRLREEYLKRDREIDDALRN